MNTRQDFGISRIWQHWITARLALALAAGSWCSAAAWEQEPPIVMVEEDWELVIGQPGTDLVAPHVATVISPVGNADQLNCMFALNPQDESDHCLGGMHMVVRNDGNTIAAESAGAGQSTVKDQETVRWTIRMTLSGGRLTFEIVSGVSETWGTFSGLQTAFTTNVTDLNSYSPEVSVESSGVGYASYRVQSLVLSKVRRYRSNGQMLVEESRRSVHPR